MITGAAAAVKNHNSHPLPKPKARGGSGRNELAVNGVIVIH